MDYISIYIYVQRWFIIGRKSLWMYIFLCIFWLRKRVKGFKSVSIEKIISEQTNCVGSEKENTCRMLKED